MKFRRTILPSVRILRLLFLITARHRQDMGWTQTGSVEGWVGLRSVCILYVEFVGDSDSQYVFYMRPRNYFRKATALFAISTSPHFRVFLAKPARCGTKTKSNQQRIVLLTKSKPSTNTIKFQLVNKYTLKNTGKISGDDGSDHRVPRLCGSTSTRAGNNMKSEVWSANENMWCDKTETDTFISLHDFCYATRLRLIYIRLYQPPCR